MLVSGSKVSGAAPAFRRLPRYGEEDEMSLEGRRFEVSLLVAGLPAAGREAVLERLLPLVEKRPAWNAEDVGVSAAEQCRGWWRPLTEERLRQQTPRGLLLTLLNRVVRRVWLLHQGQRVAQVYGELERQLGDAALALALAWESQMVADLSRVGILN